MNTAKKGSSYENAFKHELYRRGAQMVTRAAGSKGVYDLVAVFSDAVVGYQLKNSAMTCNAARNLKETLPKTWNCLSAVVHPRKGETFCEH